MFQYHMAAINMNIILTKGFETVKILVNGSQDGAWGLTESYINDAQYHKAIDSWLSKHGDKTIYCFVQFKGVNINANYQFS